MHRHAYLGAVLACLLGAGCFMPKEFRYTLNTNSGALQVVYHDIRSDEKEDSAVAADWEELRSMAATPDTSYDTAVIAMVSQELFAEDRVLSGRRTYQVRCPKCFPSKQALLSLVIHADDDDDVSVLEVNDEIFMFLEKGSDFTYSNGTLLRSKHSSISVWPADDSLFEFSFRTASVKFRTSLLPHFKREGRRKPQ